MTHLRIYKPLCDTTPSIRLLTLQPSKHEADPICCNLHDVSLLSNPIYEALSYTWDLDQSPDLSETASYVISLEDHPLPITPNLYFALEQLRRNLDQPRTLWIDAICINQNDNTEKGKQVQAMSTIYSQATKVLIWLGKEEKYDINAFALIERFRREFPKLHDFELKTMADFKNQIMRDDPYSWGGLGALLQRRWFTRAWVLQEVVMAREALVMSGNRTIPWGVLANVVGIIVGLGLSNGLEDKRIEKRGFPLGTFFIKIQKLKTMLESDEKIELLNAMGMTRTLDATDPRDKIFSVLAFVQCPDFLKPDYTLSIDELLRRVNIFHVTPTVDFRFLSFFDARSVENPCKLTPWGPNFLDVELNREAFVAWSSLIQGSVAASHASHVSLSQDESRLSIRGIVLDEISQLSCKFSRFLSFPPLSSPANFHAHFGRLKNYVDHVGKYLSSCQEVARGANPLTHPGHNIYEAFWRTLICNLNWLGYVPPPSFANDYLAFIEFLFRLDEFHKLNDGRSVQYPETILEKGREGSLFERAMARAAAGRVFCITKSGYMGMVPVKSRKGDLVCAFLGANTMFVVRPKRRSSGGEGQEGTQIYRLIGECYIHGTTNEEILDFKEFERRLVDITLG